MSKKPQTAKTKKGESLPAIIRLIRARAGGTPVAQLAKATGIPYSRAHCLLNTPGDHKLANIEKALRHLAPEVLDAIEAAAKEEP